jgi:hypothetical protein
MAAKRRTIDPHTNPVKRGIVKQQKNGGADRATQQASHGKRQSEK